MTAPCAIWAQRCHNDTLAISTSNGCPPAYSLPDSDVDLDTDRQHANRLIGKNNFAQKEGKALSFLTIQHAWQGFPCCRAPAGEAHVWRDTCSHTDRKYRGEVMEHTTRGVSAMTKTKMQDNVTQWCCKALV